MYKRIYSTLSFQYSPIIETFYRTKHPPLCFECKHYIPFSYSPHFPNASCERFKPLITCMKARTDEKYCGYDGKHFERM